MENVYQEQAAIKFNIPGQPHKVDLYTFHTFLAAIGVPRLCILCSSVYSSYSSGIHTCGFQVFIASFVEIVTRSIIASQQFSPYFVMSLAGIIRLAQSVSSEISISYVRSFGNLIWWRNMAIYQGRYVTLPSDSMFPLQRT